jgi:hypothetical protein
LLDRISQGVYWNDIQGRVQVVVLLR